MHGNVTPIVITQVDYRDAVHASALVDLLDVYARDPMGGGAPLSAAVLAKVVPALASSGCAFSWLAFSGAQPCGLLNGFQTVSTFAALPVFNIHDIIVAPGFRRRGIARQLLAFAEASARKRGCCKLTLEVLEGNDSAQALYRELGFRGYSLTPATGNALFWQKPLPA